MNAVGYRKAKSVRLPFVVIGVLPQEHDLHFFVRRKAETVENVVHVGVDYARRIFGFEKRTDLLVTFVRKERREGGFPIV